MARSQAVGVAEFSMLVPIVGLSAAFVFLGELCGAALDIIGVLAGTRQGRIGWADDLIRSRPSHRR